ncbi:MAG: ribonuclease HII [Candidatus Anstonellales archaeon]
MLEKRIYCGIDEAGRGCLIGPLIICLVVCDNKLIDIIEYDNKIKDSKLLKKRDREKIVNKYKKMINYKTIKLLPKEIDNFNINELEMNSIKKLLSYLETTYGKFDKSIVIDSPFRNNKKITEEFAKVVDGKIILEHKADRNYKIVSLASIFAKVFRDKEIEKIKKKIGIDFGSGYPSDEKTLIAIKTYGIEKFGKYIRKKWKTFRKFKQRRLDEF